MPVTSPDSIYFSDTTTTLDLNAISGAEATSTQAALALRQRYEFVWANAAARTSQTGMVTGATGYQVDTRTEYIYESATWRLKTPHAEFTASKTMPSPNGPFGIGVMSLDSAASTSSVFVTPSSDGILVITDPGIYAVSTVSAMFSTGTTPAPATGRTFLDLSKVLNAGDQQRVSIATGEDRGSLAKPNLRTTTSNTSIYFAAYTNTGGNPRLDTRIAVTRLG